MAARISTLLPSMSSVLLAGGVTSNDLNAFIGPRLEYLVKKRWQALPLTHILFSGSFCLSFIFPPCFWQLT
jgi:hypothetical protein